MSQKYNNGARLLLKRYAQNEIVPARVIVYDVDKETYRVVYANDGSDIIDDVPENDLLTLEEIMQPANSINVKKMPPDFQKENPGKFLFVAGQKVYVGSPNSLGQWQDHASLNFIPDVGYYVED